MTMAAMRIAGMKLRAWRSSGERLLCARSSHPSLAKFYYLGRGEFAKTRADYDPRLKLNLAIEEHFTPGAAPVAYHNPNNDCL
jgi:hypothetical protein